VSRVLDEAEVPRWFRALTISGKPAGLGFQCPKCHHGIYHSAPEKVFHCGAWEHAPRIMALLPTRRLGGDAALPSNVLKIGLWDL
jgi:hypothetical protein